jgi:rare lipoprotein A
MVAWQNERQFQRAFPAARTLGGISFSSALLLSLLLAGCASAPPRSMGSGTAVNAQSGCHAAEPNLRAAYNRTYTVKGRSYTPLRNAAGYEEVGTASWYGWESGSTTSMGTRFNPRDFSAASRVLPLPTCVQVTNLDNGLSALVLVNDRGPFVSSRILDLSMGAAAALGITRTGTARVRIVALPDGANAPLQLAAQNPSPSSGAQTVAGLPGPTTLRNQDRSAPEQFAPQSPSEAASAQIGSAPAPIEVQTLAPLTNSPPQENAGAPQVFLTPAGGGLDKARPWGRSPVSASSSASPELAAVPGQQTPLPQPALTLPGDALATAPTEGAGASPQGSAPSSAPQTFVQTGAFTLEANAQTEKARMQAGGVDDVLIVPGYIRGQMFYRVQVGPLNGMPDATLLQKLQALGLAQYSVIQQ